MKRFIKYIIEWFIIIYMLVIGLDIIVSSGLRKTDIRKYAVWNDIYHHNIDADLVIIGSSRAWCGYNTYILDSLLGCNTYNLGLDGHSLDAQIIRFDAYLRNNMSPKYAIINCDFLSTFGNSADIQYEREQYFPYVNDKLLLDKVAKGKHISNIERYFPFVRYFGYHDEIWNGVKAFFGETSFDDGGMYKGYRGNEYAWTNGALDSDALHDASADISDDSYQMIAGFIFELQERGVHPVLVKSPVYSPLFQMFINIEKSDSLFATVASNFNVPLLDYYHVPLCDDKSNFYNPSHLNKKGSDLFTLSLANDLKRILNNYVVDDCNNQLE